MVPLLPRNCRKRACEHGALTVQDGNKRDCPMYAAWEMLLQFLAVPLPTKSSQSIIYHFSAYPANDRYSHHRIIAMFMVWWLVTTS